jgi:hypothetical protein
LMNAQQQVHLSCLGIPGAKLNPASANASRRAVVAATPAYNDRRGRGARLQSWHASCSQNGVPQPWRILST